MANTVCNQKLQDLQERLDYLVETHKKAKLKLPKKTKSRKWAIWLLQGASLSLTNRALRQVRDKENPIFVFANLRLASEIKDYTEYFARQSVSKKSQKEEIEDWFQSQLSSSAIVNSPQYSQYKKGDDWRKGEKGAFNRLSSAYVHPSYDLVKHMFGWSAKKGSLDFYKLEITLPDSEASLGILEIFVSYSEMAIKAGTYLN